MPKTPKQPPITLDPQNANRGTTRGRAIISESLTELGAGRSIVVDKNGVIIAGNKTFEAWENIDGPIQIVNTDGKSLIVVQREDLDLSDVHGLARRLAYFDNRSSELDLSWDPLQVLADMQDGVDLSVLFNEDELNSVLADVQAPEFSPGSEDDQGALDQNESLKNVTCPACGHEFEA